MSIAVMSEGMPFPKIIDTGKGAEGAATTKKLLSKYYAANPAVELYRVITQSNGDYRLKKLRLRTGTEVTEVRVIAADFEDVN